MEKKILDGVGEYTPCKITECYFDDGENVEITSFTGTLRLHGMGRSVWIMCDGCTPIAKMVEKIASEHEEMASEEINNQVIAFIDKLKTRQLVESNWDPLYKYDKEQRIYDE